MVNDVIGVIDIVSDSPALQTAGQDAPVLASVTATVCQGPLIVDAGDQQYQQISLAALASDVTVSQVAPDVSAASALPVGSVEPTGLRDLNSGAAAPHAGSRICVAADSVEARTSHLTGQKFYVATVRNPFEFSLALPASALDTLDTGASAAPIYVTGTVQFSGSIQDPAGCSGDSCGCGDCGCGGH